ncbi:MAG: hypothetical protein QNJ06_19210, partial [Kiloniellales bacterium]|nr:hypothetical protein [Kiloniellales bacterium]
MRLGRLRGLLEGDPGLGLPAREIVGSCWDHSLHRVGLTVMRSLLSGLVKKLTRLVVRAATFHLPKERKIEVERWVRGLD